MRSKTTVGCPNGTNLELTRRVCAQSISPLTFPVEIAQIVHLADGLNTRGELSWALWALGAWPALLLCWCTGATLLKLSRDRIARDEPATWQMAMGPAQGYGSGADCAAHPWCGPYGNCCCLASRLLKALLRAEAAEDVTTTTPRWRARRTVPRASYSVLWPLRRSLPSSRVAPAAQAPPLALSPDATASDDTDVPATGVRAQVPAVDPVVPVQGVRAVDPVVPESPLSTPPSPPEVNVLAASSASSRGPPYTV